MEDGLVAMDFSLSSQDICAIIKTCAESGVKDLTLGVLSISFGHPATAIAVPLAYTQQIIDQPELAQTQLESSGPDLSPSRADLPPEDQTLMDLVENPSAWEDSQLKDNKNV